MEQNQRYIMFGNWDNMTKAGPISSWISEYMRITEMVTSDGLVDGVGQTDGIIEYEIFLFCRVPK